MDDSVCMVWLAMNLLHFYRHESCGKCTPCREGGDWLYKLLMRVENGEGRMKDIDLLFGVANNIVGKTLCAFGDAAATPVLTTLKLFRHEFEAHVKEGRCTLPGAVARRASGDGRPTRTPPAWTCNSSLQFIVVFAAFFLLVNTSAVLVLAERKVMGFLQQRYGPYLVGPHGMLQPLADILKLLMKEELRPKGADKWLFTLAPVLAVTAAFAAFATVPFGGETTFFGLLDAPLKLGAADVNVGILVVFAMTSMGVYGIVLAGWSSNSKYSLFGGLRASAQMISYELSYATALAAIIMLAGSMSVREMVDSQTGYWLGVIPKWYIFLQPVGFIIYLIAGMAETNRAPFDFPEAEQELVAGFNTEYSSVRFALFPQAEYINMVTVAGRRDRPLSRRLARLLPFTRRSIADEDWNIGWAVFFAQDRRHPLLLHLDALDAAALPLRPADVVRLEVAAAGVGHQPSGHRGDGAVLQWLRRWRSTCSRASRSWPRRSSSGSATRCTA